MPIPDVALLLAGFVLAHAAWSVSDVPELLVPLAILERQGARHLVRFEAETQEAAISKGKAATAEASATADAWAFAREGLMNNEYGSKTDVFLVDFWARGMSEPATIIQPFEPYAKRHHFRIVGTAMLVVDGKIQDSTKAAPLVAQVDAGIRQHSKAAPLWAKWR